MKKQIIEGYENKDLVSYIWDDVKTSKAVIQIIHGMQEHAQRYDEFAKSLNNLGYIVFASDLRGHGETCGDVKFLGHTHGDIFKEIVSDQILITEKLKKQYDLPIYIFAHSFGSFIAQRYAQVCNLSDKIVLSGTAYTKTPLMWCAKQVAYLTGIFKGNHVKAKLIEKLSFGSYAKKFEDGNWLTTNNDVYKKYKLDPYCGTPFPVCFYKNMFKNILKNYKDLKLITPEKQILIISGYNDPVGGYGKLATKLNNVYLKNNVKSEIKLYKNERHELINGHKKEEVLNDIVTFFEK